MICVSFRQEPYVGKFGWGLKPKIALLSFNQSKYFNSFTLIVNHNARQTMTSNLV